jgi:hypothetical protein
MIRPIRILGSILALAALANALLPASESNLSNATNAQLIDLLTQVDARTLGIDGFGMYSGFIAEDAPLTFDGGLLGVPRPKVSPLMRELVRRGPAALPELVAHVDDSRPTRLEVGNTAEVLAQQERNQTFAYAWMIYSDEYDPRFREPLREWIERATHKHMEKPFEGAYTVKVGDIC